MLMRKVYGWRVLRKENKRKNSYLLFVKKPSSKNPTITQKIGLSSSWYFYFHKRTWMRKGGTEGRAGNTERTSSAERKYLSNALNSYSESWNTNSCLKLLISTTQSISPSQNSKWMCVKAELFYLCNQSTS